MKKYINTLLTFIMVCILAFGVYMNSLTIKESTSWNKKNYAQNLAVDHNERMQSFRDEIKEKFPDIDVEGAVGISSERATEIIDTDPKTNEKIKELLNYLECLVSAYVNEIADQEMMRKSFGVMILKYYRYFENYLSVHKQKSGSRSWQVLEDGIPFLERDLEDHDKIPADSLSGE